MAEIKVSALPSVGAVGTADVVAIIQNGSSRKATIAQVAQVIQASASNVTPFTVIAYAGSSYPARPASSIVPAGYVRYIGPVQPTDWLNNDEWINNS